MPSSGRKAAEQLGRELMGAVERGGREEAAAVGSLPRRLCGALLHAWGAALGAVVAAALLAAAYALTSDARFLAEALLAAALFALNVAAAERDATQRRTVILRKARAQVGRFLAGAAAATDDRVPLRGVPGEVAVKRGGAWSFVLPNMLCPGDTVLVPRGAPVPSGAAPSATPVPQAELLHSQHQQQVEWLGQYTVERAPGCVQLEEAFEFPRRRPPTKLERYVARVERVYAAAAWATFVAALVVGLLRWALLGHDAALALLAMPAYVLLAQLAIALPYALTALVESFANARILSVFHVMQEASISGTRVAKEDSRRVHVPPRLTWKYFAALLFDTSPAVTRCSRLYQNLGAVTACVFLDKDATLIEPTPVSERVYLPVHSADAAGSSLHGTVLNLSAHITESGDVSLTFDDKRWTQHLPVLKPIGLAAMLHRPLCRSDDVPATSPHICAKAKMPPGPAAAFAAADAADDAAALAGPTPAGAAAMEAGHRWKRAFVELTRSYARPYSQCMCLLSTEIGFTEKALDNFVRIKEIHTYASLGAATDSQLNREPPYMASLVVKDVRSKTLQLLSKGCTPVLLSHCSAFWDGTEVREMTQEVRERIEEEYRRLTDAYTVVAFSYKPIHKRHAWLFARMGMDVRITSLAIATEAGGHGARASENDKHHLRDMLSVRQADSQPLTPLVPSHETEREADSAPEPAASAPITSAEKVKVATAPSIAAAEVPTSEQHHLLLQPPQQQRKETLHRQHHRHHHRRQHHKSTAEADTAKDTQPVNPTHQQRQKAFEEIQTDQIFIGMAALMSPPREGADAAIELLKTAGIRFMFFSSEDARRSTHFAAKLGLETDWNCIISLRDPLPSESPYMDGPARLPRGISNIRTHIKTVDPVPLIVPVFCDCTAESSAEMVDILQENGEVVMCVGNAIETRSTQAFARASVSASIQPAVSSCLCADPNVPPQPQPPITSKDYITSFSTGNLSADLTSLPCSFVMHSKTPFHDIPELIREGRHVLGGVVSCTLCMLTLVCAAHGIAFVSELACIPPVFNGYQLLWLTTVIVPLLSLPMLTGSLEGKVMQQHYGKSQIEGTVVRHTAMLVISQAVPIVASTILVFLITLAAVWGAGWNALVVPPSDEASSSGNPAGGYPLVPQVYAQNMALLAFVLGAVLSALAMARPSTPIPHTTQHFRHTLSWGISVLTCFFLQLCFFFVSLRIADGFALLHSIPWLAGVLLAVAFLVVGIAGVIARAIHRRWWDAYQLELRLVFDTKLGMYSPVQTRPSTSTPNK